MSKAKLREMAKILAAQDQISVQAAEYKILREEGLCTSCRTPSPKSARCPSCAKTARMRGQKRTGGKPWGGKGSVGRPVTCEE